MSQHFPADILYALDNPRRRGHQVENHDASHVITPSAKQTHQYQHAAAAQAIAAGLRLAPPPYTTVELMRLLLSRKYGPVHMKCASSREVYVPRIDPRNVPKEITITIDRICLHVPDYLLAVHSSDAKEASLSPMIFPIRKLFVAMFCTNSGR
ncbi:hypothetical protein BT96DRAFT_1010196 [Gymnopus androsaceus JB14]|uniref:Uncharacterized protein n=1 Tax=Gymnopus androsaceus JB14 TaxID=1447944 RepID=A0A6A4GB13_9AGAR|nr:hypothetical protein BT96DRAFT_1010196 [Gymnopus androsaceus JB14]